MRVNRFALLSAMSLASAAAAHGPLRRSVAETYPEAVEPPVDEPKVQLNRDYGALVAERQAIMREVEAAKLKRMRKQLKRLKKAK